MISTCAPSLRASSATMAPTRSTAALSCDGDSVSTRVLRSCFVSISFLGGQVALSGFREGHIETINIKIYFVYLWSRYVPHYTCTCARCKCRSELLDHQYIFLF